MPDDPAGSSPSFIAAGDDDALRLPDSADLLKALRFWPRDGKITLGDERMVLVHLGALVALRGELVAALGVDRARAVLTHMGYVSGHRDGEHARKIRSGASYFERFAAGPQLHALEGMVSVTPLEVQFDLESGRFRGEFAWRNSAEVEAHLADHPGKPHAAEPVCWMMVGYASGYTSLFMGRPVIFRELACRACGARHCRIFGTPLGDAAPPPEFAFLARDRPPAPTELAVPSTAPHSEPVLGEPADLVGAAAGLRATWSLLARVAATHMPVLLLGEPGVGKRHLAGIVHARSGRAGPLVPLRAGGLRPDELDAAIARAHAGSLLLADLDDASPDLQARLLHALEQDGPRWLATVREDPSRLRPELRHRLGMFPVHVPPLRERREDIVPLVHRFLGQHAATLNRPRPEIRERAIGALLDHDYPGNVGELWALVARACVLALPGEPIDHGHLFGEHERGGTRLGLDARGALRPSEPAPAQEPTAPDELVDALLDHPLALDSLEQALIRRAVERAGGNLSAAARMLGLTRPQLAYRHRKG